MITIILLSILILGIEYGRYYKDVRDIAFCKDMKCRAYKFWLVQQADDKVVASIANQIYQDCQAHTGYERSLAYEVIEEFTKHEYFTSKTFIVTARAVVRQVRLAKKYGY
jgi:hypothetical protein